MKKRIFSAIAAFMIVLSLIPPIPARATIDPATGGFLVCSFASLALELYKTWRSEHPNASTSSYPGYNPGGVVSSLAGGTTVRPDGGSSSSGSFGGDDGDLTPTPTPADFSSAYSEYVTTLPAPEIGSDGVLYIKADHNYSIEHGAHNTYYDSNAASCPHGTGTYVFSDSFGVSFECDKNLVTFEYLPNGITVPDSNTGVTTVFHNFISLKCPIDGVYSIVPGVAYSGFYTSKNKQESTTFSRDFTIDDSGYQIQAYSRTAGSTISGIHLSRTFSGSAYNAYQVYFPDVYFKVVPTSVAIDVANNSPENDYSKATRPAALSGVAGALGGVFGTVDAEGNVLPINLDGLHIVNEDNGTVYNPVTGDTTTYDEWNYDYSDRSYHFTNTSTGNTSTVTYGDENITIREGGNTYNIYYLMDASDPTPTPSPSSSSSPTSTPVQPVHVHSYTDEIIREATCINPGSRLYTCSCGDSYTASIPALGHDWNVKSQVLTTYDDTGQVLQDGYIIYECSRCGEQYKDTSGQGLIPDTSESDELVSIIDQLQSWRLGFVQSYKNFSQLFADLFLFIPEELRKIFYWGFGASILSSVLFLRLRGR